MRFMLGKRSDSMRGGRLFATWTRLCALAIVVLLCAARISYATDVSTDLFISICGDGIIEPGELCDDGAGNNTGAYGSTTAERHCAPGCESYGPYCGDGILQVRFGEQCDQGSANGTGGLCSATCQSLPPAAPVSPPTTGSPPVGSIPQNPNANQGTIPS